MKKLICLLLCLLLMPLTCPAQEMTDEEITALLYELLQQENADGDYLVLPETYQEPVTGAGGVYSLLIVGVDSDVSLRGRSDTMLLCVLDTHAETLKMISFMRDLYVSIPGKGHNKLNAAYSFGGADLLLRTLEDNFGVRCDGYLAVNYSTMVELVDAIGGVELTVADEELKPLNGVLEYYNYLRGAPEKQGRLEAAGTQVLTGLQTMSYARIRKLDSDFMRVSRQQRVLTAIYERLLTLESQSLLDIAGQYMTRVGTNVTLADALELVLVALSMEHIETQTLRIPVDKAFSSKTINGTYYIVPNNAKNEKAVRDFLAQ